ncbi:Uncharacterised protein [Mycobacteroides abscessus subsp. abscessus]|nr:Uncharacterised protein [Mycobacteroides abscessus subsp. abscessus]
MRVDTADPVGYLLGPCESNLHRNLLIQEHRYHQGQRVVLQQLIGGRVLRKLQSRQCDIPSF